MAAILSLCWTAAFSPLASRTNAQQLTLRAPQPIVPESCETFGPQVADFRISEASFYDQIWAQVARGSSRIGFAWSAGQDVLARIYDLSLQPVTGDFLVNSTLNVDVQDEPALAFAANGNMLVAWSERFGYDGHFMGVFGRVYDSSGAPLGSEFQINQTWWTSQWRPLIAPTPSGGFVVAWSTDWDGDSAFRILDATGAPLTGDITVNDYEFDAQVDPAPAVNAAGTIFIAFIDYSSHGGVGSGINLYGRTYDAAGTPLQASEFLLTTFSSNGDQREPRVAADGLGRFIVAWEDEFNDGSSYGIFARIFGPDGAPLGPEFIVNATTDGYQHECTVAADAQGRFTILWEDWSTGVSRIVGQRFTLAGQRDGDEFVVNESPASGTVRPVLSMDPSGSDLLVAYDAPGEGVDVMARRFTLSDTPTIYCDGKINQLGCLPYIGYSGSPSYTDSSPFWITAGSILNQKRGVLMYSFTSTFTPFEGATLCIGNRVANSGNLYSGGTPGVPCTGSYQYNFNALIQSGANPLLVPGRTVSAQYYYDNAGDPTGFASGYTNAIRFTICP